MLPMRVLLVHNYYGSTAPSGENQVFEAERDLLVRLGVEVEVFTRHSDEIRLVKDGPWLLVGLRKVFNLIKGALCTIGNPFAARALAQKIRVFRPNIVHVHNQFPLISPLALRVAHRSGAKVVMTLHNYRTVCAAGVPTRNGQVCTECFNNKGLSRDGCRQASTDSYQTNKGNVSNLSEFKGRRTIWPAIRNRCYRGSLLATVPLALNIWLYRKCWAKWVDRFVVLSEFQRERMIACGFPAEKIRVKGNFLRHKVEMGGTGKTVRKGCVCVGRLSDEKGIRVLIDAWRLLGPRAPKLSLVGDGDRRAEYEQFAKGLLMEFVGKQPQKFVNKRFASACFMIQPSICWETFGLTVIEAARVGTPAIVSDLGALPSLVRDGETGIVVRAGDAEALAVAVLRMMNGEWERMGKAAQERAKEFGEEANGRLLCEIYEDVLSRV